MSPASHVVGRLRGLYGLVLGQMRTPSRRHAPRRGVRSGKPRSVLEALEPRLLLSDAKGVDTLTPCLPPQYWLINQDGYLTEPTAGPPLDIAMRYLASQADKLGLTPQDLLDPIVTDQYVSADTGVTHLYLRQRYEGLEIANANLSLSITADGRVLNVGGGFVAGLDDAQDAVRAAALPRLSAAEALAKAGQDLGLTWTAPTLVSALVEGTDDGTAHGTASTTVLTNAELSLDPIPARLHYVATPQGVQLAWDVVLRTPDQEHWYDVSVDASTGAGLLASDWVDRASYRVLAIPTESPDDGSRTLVTNPSDPEASPYGWHDTNGVAGAEYTDTRGNNVFAQEDADDNDTGGFRPDGTASLTFDFPLNLTQPPSAYQSAAITNLFYWDNTLHDVFYEYGFDEVSGNFQVMNYTGLGLGGNPVQADAQDGSGTDNANFATPPDGLAPRMQMYDFTSTTPYRDGDLDDVIISHEYGHGVTNRLVGGPANADALDAIQSGGMGEGWSDWFGLMLTMKPTDTKMGSYPVGTYVLGQPTTGPGIRRYPYSFNMAVDPLTLGAYNGSDEVHDAGEIWCSTLWDMTWLLVDAHGYGADIAHGYDSATPGRNGGNNLALQLVMDSLKLMPANPTFLQSRNAILQADMVLTGGANQAAIWTAFARRGFGFSASAGANANSTSVTEAFDLPNPDPMVISSAPSASAVLPVGAVTFTFNEAINPASFAVAADVASFTGPGGVDLKPQITGIGWSNANRTLQINFASQAAPGTYTMVIGPQILAADNGNPMNQDLDANLGEVPDDQYAASFQGVEAVYQANMDANPGWTLDAGTAPYQWQYGTPTGSAGDPTSGHTGSNVIGYNLAGAYPNNMSVQYATTPAFSTAGYTELKLGFWRWLGVESSNYDHASVQVWDGVTWTTVWSHAGGTVVDTGWAYYEYALPASANDNPAVKVRWGLGPTDSSVTYCGWNLDDVVVMGMPLGPDTAGPIVTAQTPSGTVSGAQNSIQFQFNELMDTSSFAVASDVVGFTGPGGADLKPQITGFTWVNGQTLRVQFNSQSALGTYSMVIGPGITDDAPSYNPMNQDGDATNGETPDDRYTATFNLVSGPSTLYSASMDANPGWALDAGSAPYQWQYGTPTGAAGDPNSGHTGSNVIGYNLTGAYPNYMSVQYATTPAFSTAGYTDLKLGFWRWLGVESSSYDHASVQVWDGATWTTVWSHTSGTVTDTAWTYYEYALPASVNDKAGVKVRWGMGPTDESVTYCGWNLDDVSVTGMPISPLAVTVNQASGQADPTNGPSINFTVVFSAPVTDFATADVTLGGTAPGTLVGTVTGGGTTYNVAVTGMTGSGTVIATLPAAVAHDAGGNPNNPSTSSDNVVTYDETAPTVTINQAATQADPAGTSPVNFTVVFSEAVTDFTTGDVTLGGTAPGTLVGTVTGSGTTYNVAVSGMTGSGTVTAALAAGIAHDAAGNPSAASTSSDNTVTYSTNPLVTINQASGQADPTNASPIRFTVVFNKVVTDFATGDVTLGGTAPGTLAGTVTGGGTTYSVTVTGMTGSGTVIATLAAGVAHDAGGNPSNPSTSSDNVVTYDVTAPTVTINQAATQADPAGTSPINFTVVFSETVTDFAAGDVTLGGTAPGTLAGTVAGSGTTYNVAVSGMTGGGTVTATLVAGTAHDAAGNPSAASTSTDNSVTYTYAPPIYSANMDTNPGWTISGGEWAWGHPTGGGGLSYGYPDPTGGYTGGNVIGVDLGGDYNLTVGGPWSVTTPAIDCSGYTGATLDFMRWLNTDYASYVYATIDVSNNGTTWTNVYTNPGIAVTDNAWQHMTYSISSVADGHSAVYLRWSYQVNSLAYPYSGWNLDDVLVTGTPLGPDTAGPIVTAQTPSGTVSGGQSSLQFQFNELMDTSSFTVADDVASFTGPGGVNLRPQITGFTWVNGQALRVQFNSQSALGTYSMVIGPGITDDAPSYNPMNQDGDATNGETPDDRYTATFSLVSGPSVLYSANMDANPGWTLDPGTAPYQWQYGTPTGSSGDPTSGHTGSSVIGYNLTGAYPDYMSVQYATTPAFSTAGYTNLKLGFWRWLGVESSSYDHATIQVWDGTTWTTVWSHAGSTVTDTAWAYYEYSLPASANDKAGVKVRWGMGPTDGSVTYCGWNLDDVSVMGTAILPLSVTLNQASGQADPTNGLPIGFTVVFSAPVTDFATGDVTLGGTAPGTLVGTVSGSGATYNVAVTGMTGSGTVIATLAAGVAHDAIGTASSASTSVDNAVTYDVTAPAADVVDVAPDPRTTPVAQVSIVFTEPVSGLDLADLRLARSGGGNLLTSAQTLTTGDGVTWVLGNLSGLTASAGAYSLILVASGSAIVDAAGNPLGANASDAWVTYSTVAGRYIFYNQSGFDGNDPAANAQDDLAIAPAPSLHEPDEPAKELGKGALLPGQTASFVNYTSYSLGINGIMVDVASLADPGGVKAVDFVFRVGNSSDPGAWPLAPVEPSVTVRPGAGAGGSDRITLIWPNNAIQKQWLQVRVLSDAHGGDLGLAEDDVFYFGNAIGETGDGPADAKVNATDQLGARNHPRTFLNLAPLYGAYDFNRDKKVNATDELIAKSNQTTFLTALKMVTVPAESEPLAASDAGSGFSAIPLLASGLAPVQAGPGARAAQAAANALPVGAAPVTGALAPSALAASGTLAMSALFAEPWARRAVAEERFSFLAAGLRATAANLAAANLVALRDRGQQAATGLIPDGALAPGQVLGQSAEVAVGVNWWRRT